MDIYVETMLEELCRGKNFDEEQKNEIKLGLEFGLTLEDVKYYAVTDNDSLQMHETRLCLESGLNLEYVEMFIGKLTDPFQLLQISHGIDNGLTLDEISSFAKSKFPARIMEEKRLKLEKNSIL